LLPSLEITAAPNGIAFKQAGGVQWSPKNGAFPGHAEIPMSRWDGGESDDTDHVGGTMALAVCRHSLHL